MAKDWLLPQPLSPQLQADVSQYHPAILQLLANRGLTTPDEQTAFFNPEYERDLHDPFLFRDARRAAERILQAVVEQQPIVVYGDYDADGVTATAVVFALLHQLGARVDVYIPFREAEGYGLNLAAVTGLAEQGARLVITVDCGISNAPEVAYLQDHGVDVIVTDHHLQPLAMPNAFAILNPSIPAETYPFRKLSGSGVAFKLVQALVRLHREYDVPALPDGWEKWLLDYVAIGTIADMMPVLGENRTLITYGLVVLGKTRHTGLRKLLQTLNSKNGGVDERTVGFQIAPRINASGRLNHASVAYELLITEQEARAQQLVAELEAANRERQQLTEDITQLALQQLPDTKKTFLLSAVGKGWPVGLVGLVAGRLGDRFYRPALVISRFKDKIMGSGRSVPGFDITAALQKNDSLLSRYGGHAQACGFTLKDESAIEPFLTSMTKLAQAALQGQGQELRPTLRIDAHLSLADVTPQLCEELLRFAPYGEANPKPRFVDPQVQLTRVQPMGRENEHARLTVTSAGRQYTLVAFGQKELIETVTPGAQLVIAYEIDRNDWNGRTEWQYKLIDFHDSQKLA